MFLFSLRLLASSAARPTCRWLTGEFVVDRYQVEGIEVEAKLIVGIYRPEKGFRLLNPSNAG